MNIRDLQYFSALAELEHFGHAADRCCVSQPTLSGQIKKLESDLGVTLFERTNRRVMLTETGEQVLLSAQAILREVDSMQAVARSHRNPFSGRFRLGAFPTLGPYVFPDLVPKIKSQLPDLRLILIEEKTDTLIAKLLAGSIDAAMLALPIQDSHLESEQLFSDDFMLAVSSDNELAKQSVVDQETLVGQDLLLLEEGHCLRDQALEVCQLHGSAEHQEFKATGLETLRQMVKAGTGITLIPKIAISEGEAGIRYIPFAGESPQRTIGLVWRKTTARRQVIESLIDMVADGRQDS